MAGVHDMGGQPIDQPIPREEHQLADWEVLADAINQALGKKGIKNADEGRRAREEMTQEEYMSSAYYEKWVASLETLLVEKDILTSQDLDRKTAELEEVWGRP